MSTITEITITIDGKDDPNFASAMLHSVQGIDFAPFDIAEMARTEFDQTTGFRAENDLEPITRLDLMVTFDGGLVVEETIQ